MAEPFKTSPVTGVTMPAWAVTLVVGQGLAILMSMCGAIWWASSLTTKVDALTQTTSSQVERLRTEQTRLEREIEKQAMRIDTLNEKTTRVLVELAQKGREN